MRKPNIHLEKVTEDNVEAIVDLRVSKEQRNYVASNKWSLIDAYLSLADGEPVFPFGIYNGKTPVGFIMISYYNDWTGYEREAWLNSDDYRFYKDKYYYYVWRFMIDKRFQGRGYGKEAFRQALDFIRTMSLLMNMQKDSTALSVLRKSTNLGIMKRTMRFPQ